MKRGFTLAEILITLGIIGVVTAMTLPTLIRNYQTKVTVSKLKKTYSALQQAYSFAVKEYDTPDHWGITDRNNASAILVRDRLATTLKIQQKCDTINDAKACDVANDYKTLNGNSNMHSVSLGSASALSLTDGTSIITLTGGPKNRGNNNLLNSVYSLFITDIDGVKGPNTIGKDVFLFYLSKNGIIPAGTTEETFNSFSSTCKINKSGNGCAAWVIYNENQDYLKCNDLSWTGKHKCD